MTNEVSCLFPQFLIIGKILDSAKLETFRTQSHPTNKMEKRKEEKQQPETPSTTTNAEKR